METGKTVVLLNLENLYESLYDALNQVLVIFIGFTHVKSVILRSVNSWNSDV